jgi:hypothetical protein
MEVLRASVGEITDADSESVSFFLHTHLNSRVPIGAWAALINPPWAEVSAPNHGFQLKDADGRIVGAYVAVYSTRAERGSSVCNLAAFCVIDDYRHHALRLVRALLRQKGYLFTDLSPSGNVPAMNERLGFQRLDTATRLTLNLPRPGRGRTVTESPAALEGTLVGRDAIIYHDHQRAAAARHALVLRDDGYAYLMYRCDRRKRLPVFASPLYVGGDAAVLEAAWPIVASHLLGRGLVATLAERRVLGFVPAGPGRELAMPRTKMYRGAVGAEAVDYLYSELTLLQW